MIKKTRITRMLLIEYSNQGSLLMATLDIVETDLFFCLRPEQPGQSKWWRYDETSSGSEYLLESRYTDGGNGRLEAKLTGGGHELINMFNIAQVDHPPGPPE